MNFILAFTIALLLTALRYRYGEPLSYYVISRGYCYEGTLWCEKAKRLPDGSWDYTAKYLYNVLGKGYIAELPMKYRPYDKTLLYYDPFHPRKVYSVDSKPVRGWDFMFMAVIFTVGVLILEVLL